jgi:thiamine biosynthesis lipoprotein
MPESNVLEMQSYSRSLKLMGNNFTLTVVDEDQVAAGQHIDAAVAEISRIEQLLTTFKPESQTNQINTSAGIAPVVVDREVFELIERSIAISTLTQGAFDLTYGSIDKSLWNFDKSMTELPSAATALKMVHLINYKNILLDKTNSSVFLKEKGMRIGFGGIRKRLCRRKGEENPH